MSGNFNITEFVNEFENTCTKIQKRNFSKGQIITTYIEKRNQICILVSGGADLVRYDFNGNKTIIEHFSDYDIFGEVFYQVNTNNELVVEAKENSEILFFVYDDLYKKCKNSCKFHEVLTSTFPELILNKIINLNMRVELLTKRSIREKLLGYFTNLSNRKLNKTFSLPFSLTDLADFLSVDRSAMMREIRLLKDEGFIKKEGNKITLLF